MTARTLLHFCEPLVLRGLLAAAGISVSRPLLSKDSEVVEVALSPGASFSKDSPWLEKVLRRYSSDNLRRRQNPDGLPLSLSLSLSLSRLTHSFDPPGIPRFLSLSLSLSLSFSLAFFSHFPPFLFSFRSFFSLFLPRVSLLCSFFRLTTTFSVTFQHSRKLSISLTVSSQCCYSRTHTLTVFGLSLRSMHSYSRVFYM